MPEPERRRVSYIISTRNRAGYLDKALQNVREFITTEDELIVIDGASTDATSSVIEKHRDIVSRFQSERDVGEAHGMNKGILMSRGRYIKPMTDDDYFYPDAIRQAISVLEAHPEIDALLCGGEHYEVDLVTREMKLKGQYSVPAPGQDVSKLYLVSSLSCGLGLFLARRAVSIVGLFDTSFVAADSEYLSRLSLRKADFRILNTRLYRHIDYDHSTARLCLPKRCRDADRISLQSGEFVSALRSGPEAVAEVLGLSGLLHGSASARLICNAERLRTSRLHWLLPAVDVLAGGARRLLRASNGVMRFLTRQDGVSAAVQTQVSPFDGRLYAVWSGPLSAITKLQADASIPDNPAVLTDANEHRSVMW